MAIKDWKKVNSGRPSALKWKKSYGINEFGDEITGVVSVDWQKNIDMPTFRFISRYKNNKSKSFKTKTAALAYAKAYMRKH